MTQRLSAPTPRVRIVRSLLRRRAWEDLLAFDQVWASWRGGERWKLNAVKSQRARIKTNHFGHG
jgi:hypothetical protein